MTEVNISCVGFSWLDLAHGIQWTCSENSTSSDLAVIWMLQSHLLFSFYFPQKERCKISHRTTWHQCGGFPFAFKWDYTCCRMELSQNLTQRLDSAFSLGSTPTVIESDLQLLGDLQLSFTKIISSVQNQLPREKLKAPLAASALAALISVVKLR